MISDDERREIAARLRFTDHNMTWSEGCFCIAYDVGAATIGDEHYDVLAFAHALADLIEPESERTCKNIAGDPKDFYCSECTAFIRGTMVDDLYCCHPIGKVISHCPNCQSKVMR